MADYYPLIARAIAGLESGSSSETRRALYERARTALVAQLRGVNPPLSEGDITRERLALEEVIRKVEAEAAQRARHETRRPDPSRSDPSRSDPSPRRYAPEASRSDPSRPDPSRDGRPSANPSSNPFAANSPAPRRDGAREALRSEFLRPESLRPEFSRPETARPDVSRPAPPRPDASRSDAPRPDTSRPGDILRENARAARAAPPAAPAPPLFKRDSVAAPQGRPQQRVVREPPPPMPAAPPRAPRYSDDRYSDDDADDPRAQPRSESNSGLRGFRDVIADADDLGRASAQAGRAARNSYSNAGATPMDLDRIESGMAPRGAPYNSAPYSYDESAEEAEHVRPQPQRRGYFQPKDEEPEDKGGFPLKSAIAIGVVLMAIGAAIWLGPRLYSMFRSKPSQTVETPKDATARPKISDRVGQFDSQVAPVAQRVVLYDEDPEAPQGKQYVGTVVWRTEAVKASNGQPPDIAVRADVEIPERKLKMTLSFRRNNDASLPASHTAELTFTMPNEPGSSGVANVPGVLMKSNEQARGTPLAGLAVKVTEGFFLVGLSSVEADKARNLQLLKERSWFDIPLVYANQRRAIIAIEKGSPGERAFNDAFAGWGQ